VTAAPVVIKLGGRALDAPGAAQELAAELRDLGRDVVLVHGGGAEVSGWCDKLGIAPTFDDGLRVTDAATLDVVTAVLAGLANKRLVATLRAVGIDAVGLSALDGGIATLEPHAAADRLGAVGQVKSIDASLVRELLARGSTPVLASVGDHAGNLLNVNADDFAAALAGALGADTLVLLSDTPGLVLENELVSRMTPASVEVALKSSDVTGGMRPKLTAACAALALGAHRVIISAWRGPGSVRVLLADQGIGTLIVPDSLLQTAANDAALPSIEEVNS
jgi:acetylglutamate kinase